MSESIYYLAYESFDYESHYPVGLFSDLETLKKFFTKYDPIIVYKMKLNEKVDICEVKNEVKNWWK